MKTQYAIKTGFGYVVRRGTGTGLAYIYSPEVRNAIQFGNPMGATMWLEKAAFDNGQENRTFSGSAEVVRVEVTKPEPEFVYTDLGPVA